MDMTWWQVVATIVGPVAIVGVFVLYRLINLHEHKIKELEKDIENERKLRNTVVEKEIRGIRERLIRIETQLATLVELEKSHT